jgi:hypothetical protein
LPVGPYRRKKAWRNTIVVMATRADEIAEDGGGDNSPFTQALLAHFQIPGLELSLFFRSVRGTVLKTTRDRQEPYVFSSVGAEPLPAPADPAPDDRTDHQARGQRRGRTDAAGSAAPTDSDDDPLTVPIIGLPHAGEVRIDGKQVATNDVVSLEKFMTAIYKPDGKTHGEVGTFDFLGDDGRGGNAMGSVPIVVTSSNRPPVVDPDRVARIFLARWELQRRPIPTTIR